MLYLCEMIHSFVEKQGRGAPNPVWAGKVREWKIFDMWYVTSLSNLLTLEIFNQLLINPTISSRKNFHLYYEHNNIYWGIVTESSSSLPSFHFHLYVETITFQELTP